MNVGAKSIFLAAVALLALGCSTARESLSTAIFYRRDMVLTVNGMSITGAGVVPKAKVYNIVGVASGTTFDFVRLRSCHREAVIENSGGAFKYQFEPLIGIEDNRECPLSIVGIEQAKGRNTWGYVGFRNDSDALKVAVECNGGIEQFIGNSVCQSPAGLIQRIDFQVPVKAKSVDPACFTPDFESPKDPLHYEFHMPRGQCSMVFMELKEPYRTHVLTTLGYEDIVLRNL